MRAPTVRMGCEPSILGIPTELEAIHDESEPKLAVLNHSNELLVSWR